MYVCLNCSAVFDTPIPIHEYHDELDEKAIEEYYVCPYCKSDDYEEAVQCNLCGQYVNCNYVELKDGTFACEDCFTFH